MISDRTLITISIVFSVVGLIGLSLFQVNQDSELWQINVTNSYYRDGVFYSPFVACSEYVGISENNVSEGFYLALLQKGGNNFYYINELQEYNETIHE